MKKHSGRLTQISTWGYSVLVPYRFRSNRYTDTFIARKTKSNYYSVASKPVDRIVYCFWTDSNEMSNQRKACLKSMNDTIGVPVKLITPNDLSSYIVEGYPLHPAYKYLSSVHKADYLRCYFMYHHGGGYSDIKKSCHSWERAFIRLDSSHAMFVGYSEVGWYGAAFQNIDDKRLAKDLKTYWRLLAGNCSYIFRPHTPFAKEWIVELNHRLDEYLPQLKQHPATDPFGKENNYPIPWAGILGTIFHPLCLKYQRCFIFDKHIRPIFENYR